MTVEESAAPSGDSLLPPARPAPPPRRASLRARLRRGLAAYWSLVTAGDPVVRWVALFIVAWYVFTRGIFQGKASGDGFFGFMYLPGLVFFHTFDIAPNVPQWVPYLGHEATGRVANACPVGPIVFWFPPYLVGLGLEQIGLALARAAAGVPALRGVLAWLPPIRPPALPGQSVFDFWMAGLGSLAAGLAGVGLLFRLLVRKLGVAAARVGTVGGVLATPIVFYLVTQPLYQHATAFFCVTLFVERWDAYRTEGELTPRQLALLGAIGGLAMDMRIQEAIFLLLPGADVLRQLARALGRRRLDEAARHFAGGLLLGGVALAVFAPQLLLWHWYFHELRTPQPHGHMRWGDPAIVATLFGTRGGIFPWMPIFYLVLPGLWAGRRRLGAVGLGLALLLGIEVWVNASAWDHWGSWAFGPRRFSDATVTFAAGVGGLYAWAEARAARGGRRAPRVVAALVAFFVAYNALLAELVRTPGRLKSSGASANAARQWVEWAKGPRWLGDLFERVGYPFAQPAGWIYALVYRAPVSTFEAVVGNYLMERDCRIHAVVNVHGFAFADGARYVPEGIAGPPEGTGRLVPMERRARVLVPLFAVEPVGLTLTGDFGGNEAGVAATWNGVPLQARLGRGQITLEVPAEIVHSRSRTNELVLDLPPATRLGGLELRSTTTWWR